MKRACLTESTICPDLPGIKHEQSNASSSDKSDELIPPRGKAIRH